MGNKIAMVAFGKGWEKALAMKRQGFELWGMNDPREQFGPMHADRWYQLHAVEYLQKHWLPWEQKHRQTWLDHWAHGGTTPLYMQRHYLDLPGSVEFPKKDIERNLPNGWYHCGSFDWMVAHALLDKPDAIHLYGMMFTNDGEPFSARACLEFWLGVAMGQGVEVHVESGDLFYTFNMVRSRWQYAWDESRPIIDLADMPNA